MEEYGAETAVGDPAGLTLDVFGNVENDDQTSFYQNDKTGTKIDYSKEPPVQF